MRRVASTVALGAVTWGCAGTEKTASPPAAEFLLAAGDSTYWVRSNDEGMRLRSAPILLTQVEGRFYEVFIGEDGVDYEDAAFGVARIYARDVTQRDSMTLFDDGSVMREAEAWKRRHPAETPVDPESDQLPTDPATIVTEEIEILDVHGPWVTFNHLLDVDVADREPHRHGGRRYVVDVRTGARASLAALFGEAEARRLIGEGRRTFLQLTDSIRNAGDDRAELARETLDSFKFDSSSFGLTDIARAPAVAFMVPGNGVDGEALALNLPPIAAAPPAWWSGVQATLPAWAPDSSLVKWSRGSYAIVARPTPDGESLALSLATDAEATGARQPAEKGSRVKEWPIATVPAPAYQLIPLDAPRVSAAMHDALARAFDVSAALDGVVKAARAIPPSAHRARPRLVHVRRSHD